MKQYANQSYFKDLCKANFAAYEELLRLKDDPKSTKEEQLNWILRMSTLHDAMAEVLISMFKENQKVIVTSKAEVLGFITFFNNYHISGYRLINTDESYMKLFPKDAVSQRFLEAYQEESIPKVSEIYRDIVAKATTIKL